MYIALTFELCNNDYTCGFVVIINVVLFNLPNNIVYAQVIKIHAPF